MTTPQAPDAGLRKALEGLIEYFEDGENHDEGAFDIECKTCLALQEAREALDTVRASSSSETVRQSSKGSAPDAAPYWFLENPHGEWLVSFTDGKGLPRVTKDHTRAWRFSSQFAADQCRLRVLGYEWKDEFWPTEHADFHVLAKAVKPPRTDKLTFEEIAAISRQCGDA